MKEGADGRATWPRADKGKRSELRQAAGSWAGFHDADAFDAADRRRLGPLAAAHVHLGVVDPNALIWMTTWPVLGLGLRDVLVDEAVQPAEFLENDGTHDNSPI